MTRHTKIVLIAALITLLPCGFVFRNLYVSSGVGGALFGMLLFGFPFVIITFSIPYTIGIRYFDKPDEAKPAQSSSQKTFVKAHSNLGFKGSRVEQEGNVMKILARMAPWKLFAIFISSAFFPFLIILFFDLPVFIQKLFFPLTYFFYLIWISSIASSLYKKYSTDIKRSIIPFWISLFSVIIAISVIIIDFELLYAFPIVNIGNLYLVYFVSGLMSDLENKISMENLGHMLLFFMFLILPIGLWVIQPRVIKLLEGPT